MTEFIALADTLAHESKKISYAQTFQQNIPLTPSAKCMLVLNQRQITTDYRQNIRIAASQESVIQYLQTRHSWDAQTKAMVDWHTFTTAAEIHPAAPIQSMKLIHDKLPTNSLKSKMVPTTPNTCHFCSEKETFYHLCPTGKPKFFLFPVFPVSSTNIQPVHKC